MPMGRSRPDMDSLVCTLELQMITSVPLSALVASKTNPRRSYEKKDIEGLAQSIKKDGLIHNLTVKPLAGGRARQDPVARGRWGTHPGHARAAEGLAQGHQAHSFPRREVRAFDAA